MRIITKLSLISLFLLSLFSFSATAQDNWKYGKKMQYDLTWEQVPSVCGTSDTIQRYITDKEFKLYTISMGRSGADPKGQPVYVVSTFINVDGSQQLIVISVPGKLHTCMITHSFDLEMGFEYGELLNKNSQ